MTGKVGGSNKNEMLELKVSLEQLIENLDRRFESLNSRFESLGNKLDECSALIVNHRFESLGNKLDECSTLLVKNHSRFESLGSKFDKCSALLVKSHVYRSSVFRSQTSLSTRVRSTVIEEPVGLLARFLPREVPVSGFLQYKIPSQPIY